MTKQLFQTLKAVSDLVTDIDKATLSNTEQNLFAKSIYTTDNTGTECKTILSKFNFNMQF